MRALSIGALVGVGFASALPCESRACIWTYGTDHHGHRTEINARNPQAYIDRLTGRKRERPNWIEQRDSLSKLVNRGGTYEQENDYAVALIHLGQYDEALEILLRIEREHPGLYATAANLGTLYELRGDNELALRWIKEGIRRNDASHYRTEWLHVKILEAKIAMTKDPKWLESHSVLGLDFGDEATPVEPSAKIDGWDRTLGDVRQALEYQLEERMQFVDPPDVIVGDLLTDLGNVNSITLAVEYAIPVYELALTYGTPREEIVRLRKAHFEHLSAWNLLSGASGHFVETMLGIAAIVGLVLVAMLVVVYWRWRSRRTRSVAATFEI
jgi:tetratricopeptide (TPR) repeat protein